MTIDWKKILAVVGGLMILAAIGYGAYFFKIKSDYERNRICCGFFEPYIKNQSSTVVADISEWKTYRRWIYDFELKYPSNWKIIDSYGDYLWYTDLKYKKGKIGGFGIAFGPSDNQPKILVEVFGIENGNTLEGAYKSLTGRDLPKIFEKLDFSGREGYLYRRDDKIGFLNDETFFVKGDDAYNNVYGIQNFTDEETFRNVISSFGFIEKYPDVVLWQTYRSNDFGFEIKYPLSLGEVNESKTSSSLDVYFVEPVSDEEYIQEGRRLGFGINVSKTQFVNIKDWFTANYGDDQYWFLDTSSKDGKPIYFFGYPAADLWSSAGFGGSCEGSIVMIKNGYLYELNTCLGSDGRYSKVGETFKFINSWQ